VIICGRVTPSTLLEATVLKTEVQMAMRANMKTSSPKTPDQTWLR